jgi:hypothetical protein
MKRFIGDFATAALLLLLSASAWAQATAQLAGTVRDESGAVLPGPTVTVTQTDTGFTRTVVTDGSGAYVMPNLVETFNLLNHFNWGNPSTTATGTTANFDAGNFGQILTQAGTPRILQFGIKYDF